MWGLPGRSWNHRRKARLEIWRRHSPWWRHHSRKRDREILWSLPTFPSPSLSAAPICQPSAAAAAAAEVALVVSDSVWPHQAAHQAPLSLRFSRQEHWSGLPLPSPANPLSVFKKKKKKRRKEGTDLGKKQEIKREKTGCTIKHASQS